MNPCKCYMCKDIHPSDNEIMDEYARERYFHTLMNCGFQIGMLMRAIDDADLKVNTDNDAVWVLLPKKRGQITNTSNDTITSFKESLLKLQESIDRVEAHVNYVNNKRIIDDKYDLRFYNETHNENTEKIKDIEDILLKSI